MGKFRLVIRVRVGERSLFGDLVIKDKKVVENLKVPDNYSNAEQDEKIRQYLSIKYGDYEILRWDEYVEFEDIIEDNLPQVRENK